MASGWQRKLSRLTRMSAEEIQSRMAQEAWKRLDVGLYRIGLAPWEDRLRRPPDQPPRFFFGENNRDLAHRADLLRTHLPAASENIVREADGICRHEFRLLGFDPLLYGPTIDWHLDPVHAKRSPLKPWFKINFLDFDQVGDHKIIWELNRHQHLVTLAKAWRLAGKQAYCKELIEQWYPWQKANPYPQGINWASSLEVAFRTLSWLWVRNLLTGCAELPATFDADLVRSLQLHGRYIERYLSTYFSPNTHLLGEAVALFFLGTLCPEIPAARRWHDLGWKIIVEESERQVRPDGVYFEQALYYHVYALDFFLHARVLHAANEGLVPEQFDSVLRKMLDLVAGLSEAGPIQGFGDDDGGRVFNPRRNHIEHMTDPLILGSVLFGSDGYTAARLTEEAIWLFGDKAVEFAAKQRSCDPAASRAFESGGVYLINDCHPCPQQMMIDAGPQGIGHSGHGHADALGIRFSADGHRLLIDPGTYCYISDDQSREDFRGTGAHNTLRIDGLDQAVPDGPFAWSLIPKVSATQWVNGRTFDFFEGTHDGYSRLPDPALHRRSVFHRKGGLWIVRDIAEGQGSHLLETFWHFAPDVRVQQQESVFVVEPSADDHRREHTTLALLFDQNSAWKTEIVEGFVSPAYGAKLPAPVLRAYGAAKLPEDCAVLLLPVTQSEGIGRFASVGEGSEIGVRGYRYQTAGSDQFVFFAPGSNAWSCGPWSSDARLLYCEIAAGRIAHVIMVEGSFAEWKGQRLISRTSPTGRFEWWDHSRAGSAGIDEPPRDEMAIDLAVADLTAREIFKRN